MATTTIKPLCATCNKERGVFKCDGCSQSFCLQHTTNHRQEITKQLNQVEVTCDLIQKILIQQSAEPQPGEKDLQDELMMKIDKWERESIIKIKKVAEETRGEVIRYTTRRLPDLKMKSEQVKDEICQGRRNNDYIEIDLRAWEDKLKQLKEEILNPAKVIIQEDSKTLVSKLRLNIFDTAEMFERTSGNAIFEEKGKIVFVKDDSDIYREVRGKGEYIKGQHTLSFKIEGLNGWIFFGIISKPTPLQQHSYASPSSYGWYNGNNFVYMNGKNVCGQGHDVLQNDTINLLIDCDHQMIRLKNERTNLTLELPVDIEKCPFPWQLHINFNLAPTRIRLLS